MITYSITPPPKQSRKEVTTWRSPPAPASAPATSVATTSHSIARRPGRSSDNNEQTDPSILSEVE